METSKCDYLPVENMENVWKMTINEGNDDIVDNQPEDSPWVGKPRNIMYEFLFTITENGETTSNEDKEDPEEYIVPKEGSEASNER